MSNVVFELFAKLGLDSSEYEQGLEDAKDKAGSIGGKIAGGLKTVGAAGVAIGTALVGATTAAGTALVKGAGEVAAYGDNIDKMSQKMGISAEAYQEWDAILQHSGTSIEALKPSMKTLASAAEKGSDAFERLGISQEEIASLSQEDLFSRVISGLQGMEEGTERTYLTSQLLGRGAVELGALLNTSAEDTEKMRQRVHELGGVMSDEAVKAAAAYQDSLQDMQTGFDGLKRNLMADFLPGITTVMDGLTAIFTQDYDEGLGKISEGVSSVVNGITEKLPLVVDLASSIVESLATALIDNLPTILQAGMDLVMQLGTAIIENLPKLIEVGLSLITTLAEGITEAIPQIVPTIINVITEIAKILTNPDALMGIIEAAIQIMVALGESFLENAPLLFDSLKQLVEGAISFLTGMDGEFLQKGIDFILNMVNGIIESLPDIIVAAVEIITQLIGAIADNLPKIIETGILILAKLIVGLIQAIPKLIAAIPKIIAAIVTAFSKFDWGKIGKNILDGVKKGILGAVSAVVEAAKSAAKSIWDAITGFFSIKSPSRKMMWVGEMLDKGLAQGIGDSMPIVEDAMDEINGLVAEPKIATMSIGNGGFSNAGSVLDAMASEQSTNKNLTVILELEKTQLAKAVYTLNNEETQRVGLNLAGGYA